VTNLGRNPIESANGCQIPIASARGNNPRVTNLGHDMMDGSPWPLLLSRCESTWPLLNRKLIRHLRSVCRFEAAVKAACNDSSGVGPLQRKHFRPQFIGKFVVIAIV
jgi:hypothetical protein